MNPQTTPNQTQGQQIASLIARVDTLTTSIDKMADRFDTFSLNLSEFRERYLVEHERLVKDVSSHGERLKSCDEKFIELEKDVKCQILSIKNEMSTITRLLDSIKPMFKLVKIVGGLLLASIFALLWDIFLGNINIAGF